MFRKMSCYVSLALWIYKFYHVEDFILKDVEKSFTHLPQ